MIDRRISRRKSNVFSAEFLAECHPLFVHQRLDGASVDASASVRQTVEMERQGDHGFAGTRRCVQNDVFAVQKLKDSLFLSGVECGVMRLCPCHKRVQ